VENSGDNVEVALFPIPNVVAFPGVDLPLHVFEPRYRQLIKDCVDNNRSVGVSHTLKTIHQPAKQQTLEQALSSNQATYKPREVFSAGACEILETTSDGRIIANVAINQRLSLVEEKQSLPYRIVSCTELIDEASQTPSEDAALQKAINTRLIEIVSGEQPDLAQSLSDPDWTNLEPSEYSFRIFQFLRFDADLMQMILEAQNANMRLEMIWDLLRPR
jgi:Lon protease-like protein